MRQTVAFVGLGANLGDTRATLQAALHALAALPGIRLLDCSSAWRSAPIEASGPDFLNAVCRLQTALEPLQLLDALQAIEQEHGRQRPYRNAPRTLDLDLLLYGELCLEHPRLSLPHPRLHQRAFVLLPLLELGPGLATLELADGRKLHDCLVDVADQRLQRDDGLPLMMQEAP
ncbi:2-amino-4-hydroxy-6-hydroxymethyldihydropteridine diphosphokinase [Paucibacter sp. APW11]|uniref:2-amino-4-hydroxy-6-hydroxymethyldihydropteridine pyrophosphokinase n=1 Tax=Roseateles aquae TaxID=3077235 RepID=A0ABU3P6P8_9BURK|nr:2-amino-4-hydroxy-6-hydroxymethyldihydropteridine diphosphokinase [Paucibacter sp. APW11]MDT8998241.1 2-amino-4-hydroxy-6-hydroxymethyldihydropteridine diphosphokinase [Paucibacter sp. APW11]